MMDFQKLINTFTQLVPYPDLKSTYPGGEWKNRVLLILLGSFVILGPLAYIPATLYAIRAENWLLFSLNTVFFLVLVTTTISKKMHANIKVLIIITASFFLGILVLLLLGPLSSGFIWLFVFIIIASLFYGYKGLLITEVLSCISLGIMSIPIYLESELTPKLNLFGFDIWLVNILLLTTVTLVISILLTEIILNIEDTLKKEQRITELLKDNQKNLAREKQRAEEADILKSKFLSNMSHEIRTPLNSIMGFTSLMAEPGLDEVTLKNFNDIIKMSGEQLMRIINDIIDISKIESNQLTINIQSINVHKNLKEIINIQQNKINSLHKDLIIHLDVDPKATNLYLDTDEMRFNQIITNLTDNSIKYTQKGVITVGYYFTDYKNKTALEFFVKDTGRGIPKNALNKIFDRFSQAENIEFHEGTGLGLSIVKGLLDLLGGTIRVESEINKGSTFYFILPYSGRIVPGTNKNTEEPNNKFPDYSGKTIYIAEDDLTSFYYMQEIFRHTNAHIEHAVNGKKLLNLIEKQLPDLILLDINMPIMNGFETIQEIRTKHTDLKVIAQTAYAMAEEKQKCLSMGCNSYISKPIKRDELFKLIDKFL